MGGNNFHLRDMRRREDVRGVLAVIGTRPRSAIVAHVLLDGKASYILGEQLFIATAPYVVKIPVGVPHAFLNVGSQPFRLVSVFPDAHFTDEILGPNPLLRP